MQAHFRFSASGAVFGKSHRNMTKSAKPCRKCGLYLWKDEKNETGFRLRFCAKCILHPGRESSIIILNDKMIFWYLMSVKKPALSGEGSPKRL